MFTDPISITKTGGSAKSLARTSNGDNSAIYRTDDGALLLRFSHSYGRRDRHQVVLVDTKTTADPLLTGSSFIASASVGFYVDVPKVGYTIAEQSAVFGGLSTWASASSFAAIAKLLGGES